MNQPTFVALESSASAGGPFAREDGIQHDATRRTLALPLVGAARFFRLFTSAQTRIAAPEFIGEELRFRYEHPPLEIVLQSAASAPGPYEDELDATVDLTQRTVTLKPRAARVYRLRASVPLILLPPSFVEGTLVFRFELAPRALVLQSSAQAAGPYADESGARLDIVGQTIHLPRLVGARFYRLRSDVPLRITSIQRTGDKLIFQYE